MKSYLLSRRMLANIGVLAFLGVWFVTLAPTVIHGPAAYVEVNGHSMDGTYKTGDLILTHQRESYARGDIIVFKTDMGGQVVHRIIGGNGITGFTTQGDNNPDPDPWHPTNADVVGKAWHRFEGKAWVLHLPRQPWFAGVTAGLLTLVVLGLDAMPSKRKDEPATETPGSVPAAVEEPVTPSLVPSQRVGSTPGIVPSSRPRRVPPTPPPATVGAGPRQGDAQ